MARFALALGPGERLADAPALAISADGERIAYVTIREGRKQLFLRRIAEVEPTPVDGSDDADQPFFSPDGHWVAFFAGGKLKKAPIAGGAPVSVVDAANPRGGTWLPDDTIVFGTSNTGLFRVSAAGGVRLAMTHLQEPEGSHRWPQVLPGAAHVDAVDDGRHESMAHLDARQPPDHVRVDPDRFGEGVLETGRRHRTRGTVDDDTVRACPAGVVPRRPGAVVR